MRLAIIFGAILLALGLNTGCSKKEAPKQKIVKEISNFQTGLDVLLEEKQDFKDKNIGIITNQTGLTNNGVHIADTMNSLYNIVALFGPEHGIRGDVEAGKHVKSYVDEKTGIKVFSLYGKNRKPSNDMLKGINLLIYDIQDVGARFYTYISTLGLAMEKAAERNIPIYVLDRPNPISGKKIEGPVLNRKHKSFVGMYPIPIRYGMTVGELATMINEEGWIKGRCDLKVIKLKGWKRDKWYTSLNLPWVKPSPNIPDVFAAEKYPGMCLLEATNVSAGRGTEAPFSKLGAPWINSDELISKLEEYRLPGIYFVPKTFTPESIRGVAANPKFKDQKCHGVELVITDKDKFNSVQTGIHILHAIKELYPNKFKFPSYIRKLFGSTALANSLNNNKDPKELINNYKPELQRFLRIRDRYLMYK